MNFRRAESDDINGIKQLIKGGFGRDDMERALKRRYGDPFNLNWLIETSPVSLVCVDQADTIQAFISLTTSPPEYLPSAKVLEGEGQSKGQQIKLYSGQWDTWIADNYHSKDFTMSNTLFISFFCCKHEEGPEILEGAFTAVFKMLPSIQNIAYFLPDSLVLFPPFSSARPKPKKEQFMSKQIFQRSKVSNMFFVEQPPSQFCQFPFSLQVCHRKEFLPVFQIRLATIQDCDDIGPLLKKNSMVPADLNDNDLAQLLSLGDREKASLVAEFNGAVVGFMKIDSKVDIKFLKQTYRLELFNDLQRAARSPTTVLASNNTLADDDQTTFLITMFCMEKEHAPSSFHFLRFAFDLWPDKDFCAVTFAPETPSNELTRLLSHVEPIEWQQQHKLFIGNRFGIKGVVTIRPAEFSDVNGIIDLVNGMEDMQDFKTCVRLQFLDEEEKNPEFYTYVVLDGKVVVGAIVLQFCTDEYAGIMLDQYDIETFINAEWAQLNNSYSIIRYITINPLFESQARYIFKEIMRITRKYCLLFPRNSKCLHEQGSKRVAVKEFVNVRPRRQIEFPNNLRDGTLLAETIPYNLQLVTMANIYDPKLAIDTRIVVLGASDVCISVLENLIYTPHLHFTNLKIVSREKFGGSSDPSNPIVYNCSYSDKLLSQLAIDHYVNRVEEQITLINRHLKFVTTHRGTKVAYDYLIIAPNAKYAARNVDKTMDSILGVFDVNRQLVDDMQHYLKMNLEPEGFVLIYGRSIQAYSMIQFCLHQGVPGNKLIMADPNGDSSEFGDPRMFEILLKVIEANGVKLMRNVKLRECQSYQGKLTGATLKEKNGRNVNITGLDALFHADRLSVDPISKKCITGANLLFDEYLLIDKYFQTNDPYIFGAGPITKYKVSVNTDWRHQYCNQQEIGMNLYNVLLNIFDPLCPTERLDPNAPLVTYKNSISTFARLPQNLKYFSFDMPNLPNYVKDPATRDLVIAKEDEFCGIRISPKGYICSFYYLGTRNIPISNLQCLYGRHEKYFNRLISRFDEGVIPDFISFFNETWALALFHDKFPKFLSVLDHEAQNTPGEIHDIMKSLSSLNKITDSVANEYYDKFDRCGQKATWDKLVFDYLSRTKIFNSYP